MANGSLQGTLNQMDVMGLYEAQTAQELARLQSEAQAAAEAQAQAASQLTDASGAPAAGMNPFVTAIPQFLGNIASVIAQDPNFAERGRQAGREERAGLLQARKENLLALQQNLKEQADSARQAGDLLAEAQRRTKLESLSKQLEQLRHTETLDQERDIAREREQGLVDRANADRQKDIDVANIQAAGRETPADKSRRERMDNARQLAGYYITAGQEVPAPIMAELKDLGMLPKDAAPLGGARKPTGAEIVAKLKSAGKSGVAVMNPDQHERRRAVFLSALTKRRVKGGPAVEGLKQVDLNNRRLGEEPEQFIMRLQSYRNPNNSKKPLYTNDEIRLARDRMYTDEELE